jgi:hypothetical protein
MGSQRGRRARRRLPGRGGSGAFGGDAATAPHRRCHGPAEADGAAAGGPAQRTGLDAGVPAAGGGPGDRRERPVCGDGERPGGAQVRRSMSKSRDCPSIRPRASTPGLPSCAAGSTCIAGTCSSSALRDGRGFPSEARPAVVRPAGDRQDPHDPLPDRPDERVHPLAADRARIARDRLGGRARAGPAAGRRGARGRRPRRRGSQLWSWVESGPVRSARRHGRRRPGRRSAVRADHQPGRPAGAGAGSASRPRRRCHRDRPPRRRGPRATARALRPLGSAAPHGGRDARDRRAHGGCDRLVPQGVAAPRHARVAS